jgi:hypothetical protein
MDPATDRTSTAMPLPTSALGTSEPGPGDHKPTAERVIQTLLREWAYGQVYRSNAGRDW